MMRQSMWIIAVALTALLVPTVLRADITYIVNQKLTYPTGSITGTITTDGTIGTLAQIDVSSWNITLNDGTNLIDLTPTNSTIVVDGTDLTASTTNLMFNYDGSDSGKFSINDDTNPNEYGCYFTDAPYPPGICDTIHEEGIIINDLDSDNLYPSAFPTGNQVIATVTPEPGTAILWLTGIVLMILTRKRIAQVLRLDSGTHGPLAYCYSGLQATNEAWRRR